MTIYDSMAFCFSLAGIWVAWRFGWRRLAIDELRQSIFDIRDGLFIDAMNGRHGLSLDSHAYKSARQYLNTILATSHAITVPTLLIACIPPVGKKLREVKTPFEVALSNMPDGELKTRLCAVRGSVASSLLKFLVKVSPLFVVMVVVSLLSIICYLICRHQISKLRADIEAALIYKMEPQLRIIEPTGMTTGVVGTSACA